MPARDTFWNISATGESLFYLLGYAALLVCALLIAIRIRRYFHGRRRLDTTGLAQRLTQLAVYGLGQRKVMNKTASGMAHVLIFAGMAVLFIGTLLVAVDYDLGWNILRGHFYLVYEAFLDAFGLCFVAGLVCALCRRRALGRHPLEISWQDRLLLLLLLAIGLSAFVVEGLRLAATHPPHAPWSFAGYGLARLFDATAFSVDGLRQLHLVFWWLHAVLALTLLVLIPMTKLFHLIAAPLQIFFRPLEARSALTTPFDVVNRLEAEMAADPSFHFGRVHYKHSPDSNSSAVTPVPCASAATTPARPRRPASPSRPCTSCSSCGKRCTGCRQTTMCPRTVFSPWMRSPPVPPVAPVLKHARCLSTRWISSWICGVIWPIREGSTAAIRALSSAPGSTGTHGA